MRHKNLIRMLALGLSAALLLSGCGGEDAGEKNPSPSPSETETESESVPPEDAPKDYSKFNAYLKLADQMSDMMDILDVYFSNVEFTQDFALMEGGDYANIKEAADFYIANTYKVEESLGYVDKEPSYARADAAIRALGDSPLKLMEAIEDLSGYTQFNEYEEDGLAKAPEIHAAIWEPFQIVATYYGEFIDAMDELDKGLRDEDLEDLKKNGDMILYYSSIMINNSGDILDEIWDQYDAAASAADPNAEFVLPVIDTTTIAPLFDGFKTAYEGLTEAMGNEEEQAKVFTGAIAEGSMKLYTSKVDSLNARMNTLMGIVNEAGDYSEAYSSAREALSSMISGYNSVV